MLTVLILVIVGAAFILKIGVHATSTSSFCVNCHSMKPQVLTWEASSHSQVECIQCHVQPGVENMAKQKVDGVKQLYSTLTDSFIAPIRMPSLIPNESCLTCHDMLTRNVSASGDIIIDHQVHEEKEIACVTCHDGVAHGKVSEKRVTYKSDYAKWNGMLAKRFMEDTKYTRPQMETCMNCHELRGAPLTCETCHNSSMLPEEHKTSQFITKEHMQQAKEDILYCDTCHSYTTNQQVESLKGSSKAYVSYLSGEKSMEVNVSVEEYAKTNDYCKNCHGERPDSHNSNHFLKNHGIAASKDQNTCLTCHDHRVNSDSPVTNVSCASCHPSSHQGPWKNRHPVEIRPDQKFDRSCLQCHVEATCTSCHTYGRTKNN